MDALSSIRNAVIRQREDEASNFFTNVDDLREFITNHEPAPGVNVTVKMCCFNSERLSADNGSRVTLVNATFHGMFEGVQKDLTELNIINRKPFIAQITVWDEKKRTGSPRKGRMLFRPGAIYEFKQVHSVGFFSDIPRGSVQLDEASEDRVMEKQPPLLKRKNSGEQSGRQPKALALAMHDEEEKGGESEGGGGILSVPRTRGKLLGK
ncbi:Hypothetical protein PHPALM_10084 [Phytophthora palmivora]|uniref:Uncharacterized protein n=1 Tax=Phytophthora palmivora TaxID=4796 RepID=A0A2P4Y5N7_9STRA|nr:Hypothetical protein PHPALM_10084 [Phytophthora palmivora]